MSPIPQSRYYRTITPLIKFGRRRHRWMVGGLLAVMFLLGVTSMAGDTAIVDEVAHIPAGYAYLHYGDYRLNPEHPPLLKDLAGLPLQFMDLKFPLDQPAWTTAPYGQWDTGWNFLYHLGNNAGVMIFWARLPILLLAVAFGGLLYVLVLRRWGKAVALLTVFFYAFSPNILAHARYVTTDMGAAIFIFLALLAFAGFMERPSYRRMGVFSLALAGAQLAKFSGFLLYPFLGGLVVVVALSGRLPGRWWRRLRRYLGRYTVAMILSLIWIWVYYIPQTLGMPAAVQEQLFHTSSIGQHLPGLASSLIALGHLPFLQPLAQYLLGVAMVFRRVINGNVTYFNGAVSQQGFHWYFPELFVLKTQIAFLILSLIALGSTLTAGLGRRAEGLWAAVVASWRTHLAEWVLGTFVVFYFSVAVAGNLDLGIRHILPIYLPLFALVAIATVHLTRRLFTQSRLRIPLVITLTALLAWYAVSTISVYPSFTAYFNELIGGPNQADKYFSDSAVDWGQDLGRLQTYVHNHPEIRRIAIDYFGGAYVKYYFCARAYQHGQLVPTAAGYDCSQSVAEEWHAQYGRYPGQYIAVSETYLENDRYFAGLRGDSGYEYLRRLTPIAKIGYSIEVFKLY